jgi:hypothetical protein
LLVVSVLLTFLGGILLLNNWCSVFSCSYLSWEEISDRVAENLDENTRVSSLAAFPVEGAVIDDAVPSELNIVVSYTLLPASGDGLQKYRVNTEEFSDARVPPRFDLFDLLAPHSQEWGDELPSEESQDIFLRVKIRPRDVYRMAWGSASERFGADLENRIIAAVLLFDGTVSADYGCESVWELRILDDRYEFAYVYVVDAVTGEKVSRPEN